MASAEDLAKALESVIGKNDEEATVSTFLDTGFAPLNFAASSRYDGGFPGGRMIEIAGPPSAGKTALATAAMGYAQRRGGLAGFNDHERSFSYALAERLGLNTKERFVYKKPRTFEESITIAVKAASYVREKKLIAPTSPIVWVFDSLASMVPQSVLIDQKTGKDRNAEDRNMNDNTALARATSAHFPAFAQWCEDLDMCGIFLNQTRTKIGVMYGDPTTTPGGDSPKFYFSQRLMLSAKQIKQGDEIIGNEVTAKFIKNKVTRPFQKATYRFMFQPDGTGRFDVERSTVEFLEAQGLLKKGRPGFVEWEGKQIGKEALARLIQRENKMRELLALLPKSFDGETMSAEEIAALSTEIEAGDDLKDAA